MNLNIFYGNWGQTSIYKGGEGLEGIDGVFKYCGTNAESYTTA